MCVKMVFISGKNCPFPCAGYTVIFHLAGDEVYPLLLPVVDRCTSVTCNKCNKKVSSTLEPSIQYILLENTLHRDIYVQYSIFPISHRLGHIRPLRRLMEKSSP